MVLSSNLSRRYVLLWNGARCSIYYPAPAFRPGSQTAAPAWLLCTPAASSFSDQAAAKLDGSQPYGYYHILGLSRNAKQSDIKEAYFRLAKIYHPDVNCEENARENFDQITEAYTTLIDLTQRYFYDQHGHSSAELKRKGTPSIFDWRPKYSIYEETLRADGEASEVEDWFKAQGYVGTNEGGRRSLRQLLKNAYVELRYGLAYYDFPWRLSAFIAALVGWVVGLLLFREGFFVVIHRVENRRPIPTYLKWENDEVYDILWYSGARKNKPSEQSRGGLYHMPKGPKKKSEYSHTIYSNTRSRAKSKNLERHQRRLAEVQRVKEAARLLEEEEEQCGKRKKKLNSGFSV